MPTGICILTDDSQSQKSLQDSGECIFKTRSRYLESRGWESVCGRGRRDITHKQVALA